MSAPERHAIVALLFKLADRAEDGSLVISEKNQQVLSKALASQTSRMEIGCAAFALMEIAYLFEKKLGAVRFASQILRVIAMAGNVLERMGGVDLTDALQTREHTALACLSDVRPRKPVVDEAQSGRVFSADPLLRHRMRQDGRRQCRPTPEGDRPSPISR